MTQTVKRLKLDFYAFTQRECITAKQYDDMTRVLEIELYDNGQRYVIPPDCVVAFVATDRSGKGEMREAVVFENVIYVTLEKSMLRCAGIMDCEILLMNEATEHALSSASFHIHVVKSARAGNAIPETVWEEYFHIGSLNAFTWTFSHQGLPGAWQLLPPGSPGGTTYTLQAYRAYPANMTLLNDVKANGVLTANLQSGYKYRLDFEIARRNGNATATDIYIQFMLKETNGNLVEYFVPRFDMKDASAIASSHKSEVINIPSTMASGNYTIELYAYIQRMGYGSTGAGSLVSIEMDYIKLMRA